MNRSTRLLTTLALIAVLVAPHAAAQQDNAWRHLQDTRLLEKLIAEYEAAKAQKIFVDDENQEASKELAATLKWSVAIIAWDDTGYRYQGGSGEVVWNDPVFGAGIVTAGHVLRHPTTGAAHARMALLVSNDLFTAIADEDNLIPIDMAKMVRHPSLDLAVVPIADVLRDEQGEPIAPVPFYTGSLREGDVTLIGGYGRTGVIEIADTGSIPGSVFDGFRRAGRAKFDFFSNARPGVALLEYSASVTLPGLVGNGDSGGFATIEHGGIGGPPSLWGIIITVSGVGVQQSPGIVYLGPNQQVWINDVRLSQIDPEADSDGDGIPDAVELAK